MSGLSRHLTRLRDGQLFRRTLVGCGLLLLAAVASHRALQFALEANRYTVERLRPTTADFLAALDEINAFDSKAARSITGFRPS
jgi:hypothetical protein